MTLQVLKKILLSFVMTIAPLLPFSSPVFAGEVVEIAVKKGDYLIKIAEEHLEDPRRWSEVARINALKNPDLVYPGQILAVPLGLLRGIPADGVTAFVHGDVKMKARGSQEWIPVSLHDRVKEGSVIRTGDAGAVEIVFDDGASCLQRSNTVVGFLSIRKKGAAYEQKLSLERGRTITRILKATGREPRFRIETPSAVCAARGTVFRVSVDESDHTRSEVLEGKAEVEAVKKKMMVSEGEGAFVRKGEPPAGPRKLLPPPRLGDEDMFFKALPVRFAFEAVEGAESYRITVTGDIDGKEIAYDRVAGRDREIEIHGLEDGVYFLHALSIDEMGLEGLPSSPLKIRIRVNPLPPFITLPVSGAEYRERAVPCSWLSVGDAAAYRVQIARDKGFQEIVDGAPAVSGNSYKTRQLDYGSYFFRVRSVAADGYEGDWSDIIPFVVATPPPTPPVDPPHMDKKEVRIRWQDMGAGLNYHFQMADDYNFSNILIDMKTEKPEAVVQKPEKPGTYYVRVSAIDPLGYEGAFSRPQSFTVKHKFLPFFLGGSAALGIIFVLLP